MAKTAAFIIWKDNGRWEDRSYLQADATWVDGYDGMRRAAEFATRREGYAFVHAQGVEVLTAGGYSRTHAGHKF